MQMSVTIYQEPFGTFRATCPVLPGCVAKGKTREEALENIERAIRGYLASLNFGAADRMEAAVASA